MKTKADDSVVRHVRRALLAAPFSSLTLGDTGLYPVTRTISLRKRSGTPSQSTSATVRVTRRSIEHTRSNSGGRMMEESLELLKIMKTRSIVGPIRPFASISKQFLASVSSRHFRVRCTRISFGSHDQRCLLTAASFLFGPIRIHR